MSDEIKIGDRVIIDIQGPLYAYSEYHNVVSKVVDIKADVHTKSIYMVPVDDGDPLPLYRNEIIYITEEEAMLHILSN